MIKMLTVHDVSMLARAREMRALSCDALARMYLPERATFAFRVRKDGSDARLEGESFRYTAIVLIGLAGASKAQRTQALHGVAADELASKLLDRVIAVRPGNLGDVALSIWAARALLCDEAEKALPRLTEMLHAAAVHETVEIAWVVSALSETAETGPAAEVREIALRRLLTAYNERTGLFAHWTDGGGPTLRRHVSCFADLVYPIQALARCHRSTDRPDLLKIANHAARETCARLGPAGQWWWHYDVRTGRVVEYYPVYAVHQDAMAPMALFDLSAAGGENHIDEIARGWGWLESAPELGGASLIDEQAGFIWRKVARREPHKFVRKAQAVASRIHPDVRVPGVNALFPPGVIDDECRPYHLGWLLYAWPEDRLNALENTMRGEEDHGR